MIFDISAATGDPVARGADLKTDPIIPEVFHESRILDATDSVPDSFRSEQFKGVPDIFWPTSLTGVNSDANRAWVLFLCQPDRLKRFFKNVAGKLHLISSKVQADESVEAGKIKLDSAGYSIDARVTFRNT